ncbi:hypothetical protein MLD38_022332 [Melastoma candidum]|uniref:Uncharacterized protein n=1 Tax=Melastoma candidum TaxID=119954 RepID=A0ACB9QLY1_9MYRT|nr:hypothetical protein MLD38_022332 [Melastoma candidum]
MSASSNSSKCQNIALSLISAQGRDDCIRRWRAGMVKRWLRSWQRVKEHRRRAMAFVSLLPPLKENRENFSELVINMGEGFRRGGNCQVRWDLGLAGFCREVKIQDRHQPNGLAKKRISSDGRPTDV